MSQAFWYDFFEKKASVKKQISSFSRNGFVDHQQAQKIRLLITDIVSELNPITLLDCGCGDGSFAVELLKYCHSLVGIEISPAMADLAKNQGIDVINESIYSIFDQNSELFQFLTCVEQEKTLLLFSESLVCINNPNELIKNIARQFRDLGYILLSTPNQNSIIRKFITLPATFKLNYLNFHELEADMKSNSYFTREKIYIFSLPYIFTFGIHFSEKLPPILVKIMERISVNVIYLFQAINE